MMKSSIFLLFCLLFIIFNDDGGTVSVLALPSNSLRDIRSGKVLHDHGTEHVVHGRVRRDEGDEDDDADDDAAEAEAPAEVEAEVETETEADDDDDDDDAAEDGGPPVEETIPEAIGDPADAFTHDEVVEDPIVEDAVVEEPVLVEEEAAVEAEAVEAEYEAAPPAEEEAPPAEEEAPPAEAEAAPVEEVVTEATMAEAQPAAEEAVVEEEVAPVEDAAAEDTTEEAAPEEAAPEEAAVVPEEAEAEAPTETTEDVVDEQTVIQEEITEATEETTEESEDATGESPAASEDAGSSDLENVEKLLELSFGSKKAAAAAEDSTPQAACVSSKFGCCPDNLTPAHGPRNQGCCLRSEFGCCNHDFITPASGPDQAGCNCSLAEFGCCPDSLKAATGPDNEGCGCNFAPHGCCPDQVNAATGPDLEGCSCQSHDFGCCPDGVTIAKGPKLEGCSGCEATEFGCCEDDFTAASGPDFQGCHCAGSKFGCCPDGVKKAEGPEFEGCGELPGEACFLAKDSGTCRENFNVRWFFDSEYGGCSRFWYGQCKEDEDSGAKVGNRFMDLQSCEKRCVKPPGSGRCFLPKVKGPCEAKVPSWYFDKNWNQCMPFDYGGCLGNANRFETKQACQESCIHSEAAAVCSQPVEPGPCRGEYPRFYYDDKEGVCKAFNFTGCQGNANRFLNKESCENSCKHHSLLVSAKRRCSLSKKSRNVFTAAQAACTKTQAKWFFDGDLKGCRPFHFTGCEAGENLFDSEEECQLACPNAFPPEIDVITKLVIAEEGKEAILKVKVEANPPPTVWWEFEDEKVELSERLVKLPDGSLRIASPEMNDTGSWTIVADNRLGKIARKQVAVKVHPNSLPIEVSIPKEINVFIFGKDITLSCQVKGYPIPVIRWYKNNTPVPKSSRITVTDNNSLIISKASSIDGGSYSCRATNEHESVSDKIDIKVEKAQSATKECIDKPNFANCALIVRAKYCNKNPYYAEFCCHSCTQANQLTPPVTPTA